jgi:uncharacterized spore protein YtfJ
MIAPVPAGSVPATTSDPVTALADRLGRDQVFGSPVQVGGATVVPVARVRCAGGIAAFGRGGSRTGSGVVARPVGAFAVGGDGSVAWYPAVDVTRIVLGGQIAIAAVLVAALLRRRR